MVILIVDKQERRCNNMANNSNSNQILVPQARNSLNQMKFEIASELGFANYEQMDKGSLPSRANGYVGGNITKRLVSLGESALANKPQ
jgi:hypothetical protein